MVDYSVFKVESAHKQGELMVIINELHALGQEETGLVQDMWN